MWVFACQVAAASEPIVCPAELPTESLRLAVALKGWTPYVSAPMYLHSASPVAGPPERLGAMVGVTKQKSKTEWIDTYTFNGKYPEGVYFTCSYGEGNQVVISKKLDASIKSCLIKGKKGEHVGQNEFEINCR